jgi:hypothetical protein
VLLHFINLNKIKNKQQRRLFLKIYSTEVSFYFLRNQLNANIVRATNENSAALAFTRPLTDRSIRDRISSSLNVYPQQYQYLNSPSGSKPTTPCGHHGAGQELCYLCHQRAKRNVPIYLHEEKRIREAEEAKLLEQYQHNRDLDEQRKREVYLRKKTNIIQNSILIFLGKYES